MSLRERYRALTGDVVPIEKYDAVARTLADLRQEQESAARAIVDLSGELSRQQRRRREETSHDAETLMQIKIAIGQVAVYEGLVEISPLPRLVDELVRDHEELEARIDAVMSLLSSQRAVADRHRLDLDALSTEVARLLRGGTRTPDTIEEIDDHA